MIKNNGADCGRDDEDMQRETCYCEQIGNLQDNLISYQVAR